MKNTGEKLGSFAVHGIKPGEVSANNKKLLTDRELVKVYKVIILYPEDFDFVHSLELVRIDALVSKLDNSVSILIGSTAQDFAKKAWQSIYEVTGTVSAWIFTDNVQKQLSLSDKLVDINLSKHRTLVVVDQEDVIQYIQVDHLDITEKIFGQFKS
jgi:alkyl hydroperoxide reductase subunit AhpC